MSSHRAVDQLRRRNAAAHWAKIDPDCPSYLHEPKLEGDIGWDLEAAEDVTIPPGEAVDVPTNVRMALPQGVWAEIRARSSISRMGLQVDAGTIDTGYRGPLYALVRNMHPILELDDDGSVRHCGLSNAVTIPARTRIAQVAFHRVCPVWAVEVDEVAVDTDRGEDGFGSTG